MTTAATKKKRPLKLPTPKEAGAIIFLRSRSLTHNEIAKHFRRKTLTAVMRRALTHEPFFSDSEVVQTIAEMYEQELEGVDWYRKYANNPYGKRAEKNKG